MPNLLPIPTTKTAVRTCSNTGSGCVTPTINNINSNAILFPSEGVGASNRKVTTLIHVITTLVLYQHLLLSRNNNLIVVLHLPNVTHPPKWAHFHPTTIFCQKVTKNSPFLYLTAASRIKAVAVDSISSNHFFLMSYHVSKHQLVTNVAVIKCTNRQLIHSTAINQPPFPQLPKQSLGCHNFNDVGLPLCSFGNSVTMVCTSSLMSTMCGSITIITPTLY